jgi:hypothetical protein
MRREVEGPGVVGPRVRRSLVRPGFFFFRPALNLWCEYSLSIECGQYFCSSLIVTTQFTSFGRHRGAGGEA